jgi:hypothetical protein
MRLYNIDVVTLALDAPRKWTDNVLSQHSLPGVISVRQGVARRIPYHGILRLAVIRQLHTELGIGVANAVQFAGRLLDSGDTPVLDIGQLRLGLDLVSLRSTIDARLSMALESTPSRRRGRPKSKTSGERTRGPIAPLSRQ